MSGNETKEHAANISNLQKTFSKQQKKISVLKELVQKSEAAHNKSTSSAQEKVKNIAQRLTHLKVKARSRQGTQVIPEKDAVITPSQEPLVQQQEQKTEHVPHELPLTSSQAGAVNSPSLSCAFTPLNSQHRSDSGMSLANVGTPGTEKVLLLRQQTEQNKALMAQRASSKQHLEQLVSQLKEKFDATQQCLEDTNELGKSMSDLSAMVMRSPAPKERHKSATDLSSQPFSLEKERIKFLENRCRLLEKQLEKERHVNNTHGQGLTNVISLITPPKTLKELENKVVELEKAMQNCRVDIECKVQEINDLRKQLDERNEEIVTLRAEKSIIHSENKISDLEKEIERLRNDNSEKQKRINELEEINDVLETTRCDLAIKNSELDEQLQSLIAELNAANEKLQKAEEESQHSESRHRVVEEMLEKNSVDAVVKESNGDAAINSQVNAEMAKQIQILQGENQTIKMENIELKTIIGDREKLDISDINIATKIASLEATIECQNSELKERLEATKKLEEELMEKSIELNVLNANFKVLEDKLEASNRNKPLFSSSSDYETDSSDLRTEIQQLKQKLDESNKAMIKLKLKCKQSEKQVEKLKKNSDLFSENAMLEATIEQLQQKIIELEDEKGQWQLSEVESEKTTLTHSSKTENIEELQSICKTQTETIRLLEQQKYDQSKKLESVEENLKEMQQKMKYFDSEKSARLISEMSEINLEEQLEEQAQKLKNIQDRLSKAEGESEMYKQKLEELYEQKAVVEKKLEHYIVENMELVDKLEKLSKSSSSAESIEIVERLTQQERAEIDEFNKSVGENVVNSVNELTQTEMGPELSESLVKLREESSELMNKIELFTNERREVLEKMENLNTENHELIQGIEQLTNEKKEIETRAHLHEVENIKLTEQLEELGREKDLLASQVAEFEVQKAQLSQELTSLQKSSEVVAALDSCEGTALFDKCEKSLSNLNSELESYRKASDKNAKFNASKKLAKEAKNAHTQLSELLQKVKEASTAVETVTVVETVVAVTAPNGKALAEYEQLTAQNRSLKTTVEELRRELQDVRDSAHAPNGGTMKVPAITQNSSERSKFQETLDKLHKYEKQCIEWQSKVENLCIELETVRLADKEKATEISNLKEELITLRKLSAELEVEKHKANEIEAMELARLQKEAQEKETLQDALENLNKYEEQTALWQSTVETLRRELKETRTGSDQKAGEISRLNEELRSLRKISEEFERLMNEKQASHQNETLELTLLRKELEGKCETYECEMGILHTLVAEQKQQLIEAYKKQEHEDNLKLLDLQQRDEQITELRAEIKSLKMALEAAGDRLTYDLRNECEKLRESLKINKALVAEQLNELSNKQETIDALNIQIIDLYKSMEENSNKIIEKDDEISYLQELMETNNKELERLRKDNNEQKSVVDKLLNELHSHKANTQQLPQLQNDLLRLEIENKQLDHLNKELEQRNREQLEKLKKYAANLKKRTVQCQELDLKVKEFEKGALEALQSKKCSFIDEEALKTRVHEIESALEASKMLSNELEEAVQLKTVELSESTDLCTKLRNELDQLQRCVSEKNEIIEELRKQVDENIQKIDDNQALQEKIQVQHQRLNELIEELKAKSIKFEKSKAVIKERNIQIHRLQAQLKDFQDKMSFHPEEECINASVAESKFNVSDAARPQVPKDESDQLKVAYENLKEKYNTEKTNFQETVARLETLHDGIQAKLQENISYIETLEHDNAKFKEKICRLEECVATFEERRASMERRTNLLCAQMQSREVEYEKTEDELINRLNVLSDHDVVIGQRLLNSQEICVERQERLDKLQSDFNNLNCNYAKLQREYQTFRDQIELNLDSESSMLREQLAAVNLELERNRAIYDAKLASKVTEFDELECELGEQIEKMNSEKRNIMEELERCRDESTEQKDEIVRLKETLNAFEQVKVELERESTWLRMQNENFQQDQYELQELRMQTLQDKTEIENLRNQIEALAANHEIELQALRTQILELDTLRMQVGQNQTDDQVFIETENKRLTDLLSEKEVIIENYQRQHLQLQMAATATTQPQVIQHDSLGLAFGVPAENLSSTAQSHPSHLNEERGREKNELVTRLQRDLSTLQAEFHNILESNNELQRQMALKNQEIEALRNSHSRSVNSSFVNDVIPAPALFFTGEQISPSPFDEIIQARTVGDVEGATVRGMCGNNIIAHNPTIEDLQRNVSDLEKHAQDLENKLAIRNQRELDYEHRLSEMQSLLNEVEKQMQERESQLHSFKLEIQNLQEENSMLKHTENSIRKNMEQLKITSDAAETQLQEREDLLKNLELKLQSHILRQSESGNIEFKAQEMFDLASREQLQSDLQKLLQQRDKEVSQLKCALDNEKKLKGDIKLLEYQIVPDSPANLPVGDSKKPVPTLDMFFGGSGTSEFENIVTPSMSTEPVVEDTIVPEKAYICYPEGSTSKSRVKPTDLELSDDWGDSWDTNEATAETEHLSQITSTCGNVQNTSLITREGKLEIELQEKIEYIHELQLVIERCEQQKQELQVKSGKLMKKLKEYKTKLDELESSVKPENVSKAKLPEPMSHFCDLDEAIHDELKGQIKKLEGKLEEAQKINANYLIEKEKLLKRIDMLAAGSEKMAEMKERQDMDVQMYQVRIKELQAKLKALEEWGSESDTQENSISKVTCTSEKSEKSSRGDNDSSWQCNREQLEYTVSKLSSEIQDINAEKQELQALLEEEKSNRSLALETISTLQQQIVAPENIAEVDVNVSCHQNLEQKLNDLHAENEKLATDLRSLQSQYDRNLQELLQLKDLRNALFNAETRVEELQKEADIMKEEYKQLQSQIVNMKTMNEELIQRNEELQNKMASTELVAIDDLKRVTNENSQLSFARELVENQIVDLNPEMSKLQSKTNVLQPASEINVSDKLVTQLQEKESEITHLKQRIEDLMREDQTEKLVLEILTKNQEIHMLKIQVKNLEDDKQELEHNLSLQITNEMQASKGNTEITKLRNQIQELELQVEKLLDEKKDMEEELKVLNNHVLNSFENEEKLKVAALELDAKNIEILELRKTIDTLNTANNNESPVCSSSAVPVEMIDLNAHWEAIAEHKCNEIAKMWREHLEQREHEFKAIEVHLRDEIEKLRQTSSQPLEPGQQLTSAETTTTSTPASDSTSGSGMSSAAPSKDGTPMRMRIINEENEAAADVIIEKMQAALESQEMEIVTLKEQLAIRSAEYARLAAQYDPFKLQSTSSHSSLPATTPSNSESSQNRRNISIGDTSVVPKSELDFALYMLHQRDMRCEEMTLELVSLLEERDTLQLKLSNTLRQVEVIKAQTNYAEPPTSQTESSALTASTLTSENPSHAAQNVSSTGDSGDELSQKLCQLQTVNHSKDKVIKEEREQRIRQMEKIQQDVAKIPQEAVSELVGSDLSQSGQSPSSVLLNWLWGNKPNSNGVLPN